MADRSLDELGPVDYLIIEFPPGHQNFTGEGADELLRLHDAGIIRIMDLIILQKGTDGTVMAQELGDLEELGELRRLEAELVQTLAEEDVDHLAAAMDPGSVAAVIGRSPRRPDGTDAPHAAAAPPEPPAQAPGPERVPEPARAAAQPGSRRVPGWPGRRGPVPGRVQSRAA